MLPAFFSFAGTTLSADERAFFRRVRPAGFILFNRNCRSTAQIRALTDDLRDVLGEERPPILIDHEGGRVQMLREPPAGLMAELAALIGGNHNEEFPSFPAAGSFAAAGDGDRMTTAARVREHGRAIGAMLSDVGVTVNCAPVLDLRRPGAHDVIGDRAFGADPDEVAVLGRAMLDGLGSGGVVGVIKHIPGHGRAATDSHRALPVVDAALSELDDSDFKPFIALRDAPMAMTAHIVYTAVDPDRPATQSPAVISEIIRGRCGFDGLLMTDAIEMMALKGTVGERATAALRAGCDIVLCCSGSLAAMRAVADILPAMSEVSAERRGRAMVRVR